MSVKPSKSTKNIVLAGIGGQGIVKASDILADVAFRAGHDVKKAEVHGMSQRGGSVQSDVRYGAQVLSPMVPAGEADVLVVMEPTQVENNRHWLRPDGLLLTVELVEKRLPAASKAVNIAMLGALSRHLDLPEKTWHEAIAAAFPEKLLAANLEAFAIGRDAAPGG